MNVQMKPVLLDCLIVLAAVAVLVALSFLPSIPWLYLPAVFLVLWLTVKALRTFNPMIPDGAASPPEQRDAPASHEKR
jgi:hypothetical protein